MLCYQRRYCQYHVKVELVSAVYVSYHKAYSSVLPHFVIIQLHKLVIAEVVQELFYGIQSRTILANYRLVLAPALEPSA